MKLKSEPWAKTIAAIAVLLVGASMVSIQTVKASETIVVPDNCSTITAAVNQAATGDTIVVKSGTYCENLEIRKSISVIGEDKTTTTIVGSGGLDRGARAAVTLAADNTRISGFTIESGNYTSGSVYATGIMVQADKCEIKDNIIRNCYIGIFCSVQSSTLITQNTIATNLKDGIRFFGGSLNQITNNNIIGNALSGVAMEGYSNIIQQNTIENNTRGIGIGASYSVIYANKIRSNSESGIFLAGSQNIISTNNISQSKYGVYITPQLAAPRENRIYHNNFQENDLNAFSNFSDVIEYWDDGYPSGGNYWSDYQTRYPDVKEMSTTGIGDTPYLIYSDRKDNYPFMAPFQTQSVGKPPQAVLPATADPKSIVALWAFDTVDSNGVTPDSTGKNPAILGSTTANKSYIPVAVDGKFGKALSFNGESYVMVPPSPSLETPGEITVDVWAYMESPKGVAYNNIVVECLRAAAALPTRTLGVAVNGEQPKNASSPAVGALRAYVLTKDEGLNEIATKEPIPLNKWIHIVFTRSLSSGMHLYIDGEEKEIQLISGKANPQGSIIRQTEFYIGHDAICQIDQLKISNTAEPIPVPVWTQGWLWVIMAAVMVGGGLALFYHKRKRQTAPSS